MGESANFDAAPRDPDLTHPAMAVLQRTPDAVAAGRLTGSKWGARVELLS